MSTASNPLGAALTMHQPDVVFRLVTPGLVAIYGALMLYQCPARVRVQTPVSQ